MIEKLRKEIEIIDNDIRDLFVKRMNVSKQIGIYKNQNNMSILDEERERSILSKYKEQLNNDLLWPYYEIFLINLFALSKEYQK